MAPGGRVFVFALALCLWVLCASAMKKPKLGPERVVFQTRFGEFEMGFYPEEAPLTSAHILRLCQLGAYITNKFFVVYPDFQVQVEGVTSGRTAPMNDLIKEEDAKKMPLETSKRLKHEVGSVSLARGADPDSGGSSFSILLADAPSLDGQYTVFGKITKGMGVLFEVEDVKTNITELELPNGETIELRMPEFPPEIMSTWWYTVDDEQGSCDLGVD